MFFCIDSAELLIKRSITGIAMLASAIKLPSAEKKSFNNLYISESAFCSLAQEILILLFSGLTYISTWVLSAFAAFWNLPFPFFLSIRSTFSICLHVPRPLVS